MPAINDSLITLISSKSFEQINTAEGKEMLRLEIMDLVNSRLTEYHVIAIYFTEFVVQ
jgi:flagellar FliL protein